MKTIIFSDENLQRFVFENAGMEDKDFNYMLQSFVSGICLVNGIDANAAFYVRTMEDYCYFGMFYDETKECHFQSDDIESYKYVSNDTTKSIEYINVRGLYQKDTNTRMIVVDVKYNNGNLIIN